MGRNENDNLKHYSLHDVIEIDSKYLKRVSDDLKQKWTYRKNAAYIILVQKSKTNEFIIVFFLESAFFFVIFDNGTLKPLHALWHSHGHNF